MIVRRLALLFVLCANPALAQDASSLSAEVSPSATPVDVSSSAAEMPSGLTDAELEMTVRAAYSAAASFASAHGNYFARDGVVPPLHDAVAAAVASTYPAVLVPADAFADLDAAKVCLAAPGTELRLATNTYGDSITLVAVGATRAFAYDYDPHKGPDIKVVAADCTQPK